MHKPDKRSGVREYGGLGSGTVTLGRPLGRGEEKQHLQQQTAAINCKRNGGQEGVERTREKERLTERKLRVDLTGLEIQQVTVS